METVNPVPVSPQLPRSVKVCLVAGIKHLPVRESNTRPGAQVADTMTTVVVVVLVRVLVTVVEAIEVAKLVVVMTLVTVFVG